MCVIRQRRRFPTRSGRALILACAVACAWVGAAHALIISEVLFNPNAAGSDNGLEFVELFNDGATSILLDDYSLGWGGGDYTVGTLDLDGAGWLAPGQYIVIGGPTDPLGFDFNPDLQDGFVIADGVALFDVPAASIGGATPVDALIYGTVFAFNLNGLIDETGAPGAVDATIGAAGESASRDATGAWTTSAAPTPGTGPLPSPVPEPGTALMVAAGLALLGLERRRASGLHR